MTEVELKMHTDNIIAILSNVLTEEDFPAYHTLIQSYRKVQQMLLEKQSNELIKSEIKWNCRRLSEAPPKNKEMGLSLMNSMDKFHKLVEQRAKEV
jgi:hypothetical protein